MSSVNSTRWQNVRIPTIRTEARIEKHNKHNIERSIKCELWAGSWALKPITSNNDSDNSNNNKNNCRLSNLGLNVSLHHLCLSHLHGWLVSQLFWQRFIFVVWDVCELVDCVIIQPLITVNKVHRSPPHPYGWTVWCSQRKSPPRSFFGATVKY